MWVRTSGIKVMRFKNRKSLLGTLLSIFLGISHFSCGGRANTPVGGNPPVGSPPAITVGVSPTVSTGSSQTVVQFGTTAQFSATVTGDPHNAGVNWTVTCSATSCGSVSPTSTANQGVTTYTPPLSFPGSNLTVKLTATSITEATAKGFTT